MKMAEEDFMVPSLEGFQLVTITLLTQRKAGGQLSSNRQEVTGKRKDKNPRISWMKNILDL
jgi:hypothetical protein